MSRKPKEHGFLIAVALLFLCALTSMLSWRNPELYQFLATSYNKVFEQGHWETLFTSLFLHGDPGHLLSNSYMLFILSLFIFGTLTLSLATALVVLLAVLSAGALVNVITISGYPPDTRLVGISGVVYVLAAFWFINYVLIDRRRSIGARIIRVIGTGLVILFPTTFEETTSYAAHFHGFWIGLLLGALYFILKKDRIRKFEEVQWEEDLPESATENKNADPSEPAF